MIGDKNSGSVAVNAGQLGMEIQDEFVLLMLLAESYSGS